MRPPRTTINRIMSARKLLPNASYFAFTATPKNKTLEVFGEVYDAGGQNRHRPFHSYTMKQAIQEGFILDVLRHYTPVESYYKLIKKVEEDPEFDTKRARKKLRRYVEGHDYAIRLKAEIMVDHFHEQVLALNKIGGKARAMVVTGGIERAIQYYHAIRQYLLERKSRYQAIVAFSGEHEYGGVQVSEASLNGFPSGRIADKIQQDPYRFLICADKFQTGYDEPLLHTMYVDKILSGIKAVQTLSRLNRAHPQKHDAFVLDFMNDADTIQEAFADYYRTTILSEETDPNKLHDLKAALDGYQVYADAEIDQLVTLYLGGADRDQLDPILDACVTVYKEQLDEDGQVDFKGKAKAFERAYGFLASILPYTHAEWEKLSIFLNFLVAEASRARGRGSIQRHPLSPSIWTATGSRRRRRYMSNWRTRMLRSSRFRLTAAATGRKPNSTASRTSSRASTTSSGTSPGPMATASTDSSRRTSRTKWRPTGPTRTPSRTPTSRTRGSSTTRRSAG